MAAPLPPKPRRRSRVGCWLIGFLVLIIVVGLLAGGWWLFGRGILTNRLFDQYTAEISESINLEPFRGQTAFDRLTEKEINDALGDALPIDMGPVQDVWIKLRSGEIEIHIVVYGQETALRAKVTRWRSGVRISNPTADGLIGWVLDPIVLANRIQKLLNELLEDNDVSLTDLEITNRELYYWVEPR